MHMGAQGGQQVIKCKVSECMHWASGNNCDLREIWVEKKPGTAGGTVMSAVTGGRPSVDELDTFCASYDPRG
jgi:hypothetical protein